MATYKQKFNRTNSQVVIMDLIEITEKDGKEVEEIIDSLSLHVKDVPATLENGDSTMSLAAYGLQKLVQDRNSQLSNKFLSEQGLTGKDAIEARMAAYKETFEIFKSGKFKAETVRASNANDPVLCEAIARLKGVSAAVVAVKLKGMTKDEKQALRELEAVAEKMDEVRKEMAEAETLDLTDF